jgi:GNAT superfamily N-acetyltransferase
MANSLLEIRLLAPDDWPLLKVVRLQALRESPAAFTSHYLSERPWDEHRWRAELRSSRWIVATENGHGAAIGLARLVGGQERGSVPHVESLWVAPSHRRRGVFRSLLRMATDLVRQSGGRTLLLWVLDDNMDARSAYSRVGFVPTGARQPIRSQPGRFETQFILRLSPPDLWTGDRSAD